MGIGRHGRGGEEALWEAWQKERRAGASQSMAKSRSHQGRWRGPSSTQATSAALGPSSHHAAKLCRQF